VPTVKAEETGGAAGRLVPRPHVVVARRRETRDTVTVTLAPLDGEPRPFAPGQFSMLYAFGVGEVPISISGDPDRRATVSHTIRAVGAVTTALAAARRGRVVGVRGPFGRGWPLGAAEGGDLVIVAGGIGLAPLRPVVLAALRRRARFGSVALLVGARTPADVCFSRDLARWAGSGRLWVGVTVDRAPAGWRGQVGVVTQLIDGAPFEPARATAFVCGPEVMMRFAAARLVDRGVAPGRVWLSMERSMACAVATCGHCQFGPALLCRDGPVLPYERLAGLLEVPEL
jgi:NAD(P)H-flavin reductase